jgi:surface protein
VVGLTTVGGIMIKFGNTYLKFGDTYLSGYKVPIYNVILQQSTSGTISASPLSGHRNTEVTLSNTPNTDYIFKEYEISGSNLYNTNKFKFEESDVTVHAKWYKPDPYNPLNLPPYTIRLKYSNGVTPSFSNGTGVQVSQSPNVWDLTYENTNWYRLLLGHTNLLEVLGANTSNVISMESMFHDCNDLTTVPLFDTSKVTNMEFMFQWCRNLTSVPLFDTSKVTNMRDMFASCVSLTSVPLFNTSKVTDMEGMFTSCYSLTFVPLFNTSKVTDMYYMCEDCINVQSGALALYRQASTQAKPPMFHKKAFSNCGRDTQTGAAELAQIPSDWK